MKFKYRYRKRKVTLDKAKEFRMGEGKISGYCALFLGISNLLAVLAFLFPSYLTTTELRQVYDAELLQNILRYTMYLSLIFGALTFILNGHKRKGIAGILLTITAFALGGYNIPLGDVEPRRLSLGVDWMLLAFISSIVLFVTLEKLFPKYPNQVILRKEWKLDLGYFCFNHLMISAILFCANSSVHAFDWAISSTLQQWIQSIPIWLQVCIIIICADFVLYWEHRIYHEIPGLWPIHAVHHSIENLDWLASSRGHFIQVFTERAMVMLPIYLLGADEAALNIYVSFAALQAILIHCNIDFSFGPLRYIFVTPQFHHWHHSSEKPAIDTNYAAHTVLFDRLFNTYHMPDKHWPAQYGTIIRLPRTFLSQTLYPITVLFDSKPSTSLPTEKKAPIETS